LAFISSAPPAKRRATAKSKRNVSDENIFDGNDESDDEDAPAAKKASGRAKKTGGKSAAAKATGKAKAAGGKKAGAKKANRRLGDAEEDLIDNGGEDGPAATQDDNDDGYGDDDDEELNKISREVYTTLQ